MLRLLTKCNQTLIAKSHHHHLQSLYSNVSTSISLIKHQKTSTATDLLVSCGFKPSTKHVSVVTLFQSFNFSDTQIKTIITKTPRVLSHDPLRILQPKIDFLRSIGLSKQDVIEMLVSFPYVLRRSLDDAIIPSFDMLKHYCGGQEIAAEKIKKWPSLLRGVTCDYLAPNVKTLRDFGVPETQIVKMGKRMSVRGLSDTKPSYFRKVVATIIDMGFDPSSSVFQYAVDAMAWHSNELGWLKKINVYKKLGLSEGEIHDMFKKQPLSLAMSEKKITTAANFYLKKCNWSPSHLSKRPSALLYSLDKRVIPRCSVMQVLASRKKVKNISIITLVSKTDSEFMEQYFNNYKDEIPELLDAYQGKIKFDKFNFECE